MAASRASAPRMRWVASSGSARLTASTCIVAPAASRPSPRPAARRCRATRYRPRDSRRALAWRPRQRAGLLPPSPPRTRSARCGRGGPALPGLVAGIDGERRDAGGDRGADRGAQRVGIGHRDDQPEGRLATAASINWLMRTMSKLPGAWYSTRIPSAFAASSTPFATTDQNGSDDWPWVTTTMRVRSPLA